MKIPFILLSYLAIAAPALASGTDEAQPSTSILVTGHPLPLSEAGQSVSVIGADEIASVQGADLTRVLERLPGVAFSRNGGLGGFTGLRLRGGNAEHLLVLVDGVRVADVAAPGGGTDFGNLVSGPVGRIDLLRGANSVVWGSEAIAGVIALTSADISGVEASAEYGTNESFDAQVNAGLVGEGHAVHVNAGFTNTSGFSQAASGSEDDGFRQYRAGSRARVDLAPGLSAHLTARHARGRLDIDGYPAPLYAFADTPEYQKTRQSDGRAGLKWQGEGLALDAGYQLSDTRRSYVDPTFGSDPYYETKGRARRAEVKGAWDVAGRLRLDFGADREWTRFADTDGNERAHLTSGHALLGWRGEGVTLSAGLRRDDHSRFGGKWTLGANASIAFAPGWRARASYGEGFKVPTLYQLFSDYGNAALSPERSRGFDAGIEHGDRNGPGLHFALSAFRRDTQSLIDYVSCFSATSPLCDDGRFGFYANVGKARAEGVELELGAQVSDGLRARAAYGYVKAIDRSPGGVNRGNDLARRPRHAVTVSADWTTPLAGLALGADLRMVADSYDDAGNFTAIDGHALATIRASLPLGERFELYGRVENLTDARSLTAAGFATPGRSAYVGARARF